MSSTYVRAALIVTASLLVVVAASSQATEIPVPVPTPTPPGSIIINPPQPPAVPALRPSATFTFGDATQINARSTNGRFRLVGLHPSETVDIALELPVVLVSSAATVQPLDGGEIISFSVDRKGARGVASIRFQAGAQPGLYRVFVPGLGATALL